MNNNVLLVEDEPELREFLQTVFQENGYNTVAVADGAKAFETLQYFKPNIMVLDHNLPDIKGSEILERIRSDSQYAKTPVVFLTAVSDEENVVNVFDKGADDYIEKPFSVNILMRRIKAVLNRYEGNGASETNKLVKGNFEIDFDAYKVRVDDQPLDFTLMEFSILTELLRTNGKILSREAIIKKISGSTTVAERTIDVHVCAIRKKLNVYGKTIETIRGVGYRLHI